MSSSTEGMSCPRCQGTGVCRDCGGRGRQPCLACGGKGERATPRGLPFPCRACDGTGEVACATACESCGGSGAITPRLQQEAREKYQPQYVEATGGRSVTLTLLIVNVAVFLLTDATGAQGRALFGLMVNNPFVLITGEYWRFVTPMFLHGGMLHLAFNSMFMLQFCPQIERIYGGPAFLALYLLSGLTGDIFSWLGYHGMAGVGASGALFGVGASYIGLQLRFRLFEPAGIRSWAIYLGGFLLLGFLTGGALGGGMRLDNWAHLGGAVAGLGFSLLGPRPRG